MATFLFISRELLSAGCGVRFSARGHSMSPTIRDGEVLTVERVAPVEIRRGDILLYETERGVIAHRVMRTASDGSVMSYAMRGDARGSSPETITGGQVLGRVVSVERKGRNVHLSGGRGARLRQMVTARAAHFRARLSGRRVPVVEGVDVDYRGL